MWWFEPVWVIGGIIITFYAFRWILESSADFLGIDEDLD
jgi:hypothetical protein